LSAYLGLEFNFVETAVGAFSYSFDREAQTTAQPGVSGDPSQTLPILHTHAISAGVENAWGNAWIFDSFQLRGGARYVITAAGGKTQSNAAGANNTNYSQPAVHSTVQPVIGVGVSKAFFTLDVVLNTGSWGGVFTGPGVSMATATIKF
jgi:hypothetical protein